ncbi:MAG: small basic family protein [Candidatus Altimarinota bacterium]
MIWAFLGIFIGIIFGFSLNFSIPAELTKYSAVIIMGILDALFGAIRAETTDNQFDGIIFISGLLFNIILSVVITILGDKLGLDLYLAAAFVFTFRIFTNVGATRRKLLDEYLASKKKT